jgi:mannuronan 5-epimerase
LESRKNDYVKFQVEKLPAGKDAKTDYDTILRPFTRVEDGATETTDITNSEIAYLGYTDQQKNDGEAGLNYYGGDGSIISNSNIHHNRFGFYSGGAGHIIYKNNLVHHNYIYGIDPHSSTYDMIIKNNTVYENGGNGIICSLDCYNIIIENNIVYNNTDSGIMFSRNMTNSTARNNYVHNESQCIFISQSHNNDIYNNRASDCRNGIHLKYTSSKNQVYDNTIINTNKGIVATNGASNNTFYYNTIINSKTDEISVEGSNTKNNIFQGNKLISSVVTEENITLTTSIILYLLLSSFFIIPLIPVIRRKRS